MKLIRTVVSLSIVCVLSSSVLAQESADSTATGWITSLVADFTITQTSYSDSWAGGEAGSVNWVSNVDGSAEKQLSAKLNCRSTLRLKFGQTLTQNAETKKWTKPTKSTDLIDWENMARFTVGGYFDPYAAFRLESQFFDGSVPEKKLYLSPIKLTESVGIAREFHKKDKDLVISRLGFGVRQIFTSVIDLTDPDLGTIDSTLTDGGIESVTEAVLTLSENLHYSGKLTLYKALAFSESDAAANDYWKAIDVNWENTFTASITKIISVNLYTQLLYDKEADKRGRFKETLALGLTWRLV